MNKSELYNFLLFFLEKYGGKKLEAEDLLKCIDDYSEIVKSKRRILDMVNMWHLWMCTVTITLIYVLLFLLW